MSTSPDKRRPGVFTVAAAVGAAATAVTLGGCVIGDADRGADGGSSGNAPVVTMTSTAAASVDPTVSAASTVSSASTGSSISRGSGVVVEVGTPYSLAYLDDGTVETGGTLAESIQSPGQVAWSTSKIPLAVAALRAVEDGTSTADAESVNRSVAAAVTASDNAAAQALWDSLGTPADAGAKVEKVLRDGGDVSTRVQTTVTRPGFSSFGQTVWDVTDQVQFAAGLTCLSGAEPVLAAMGQIVTGQDYGLGRIPGALFKGGWGPDPAGTYQVRQFGLVPGMDATLVPVAIEVVSPDGSYASGTTALDSVVSQIRDVLASTRGVSPATC